MPPWAPLALPGPYLLQGLTIDLLVVRGAREGAAARMLPPGCEPAPGTPDDAFLLAFIKVGYAALAWREEVGTPFNGLAFLLPARKIGAEDPAAHGYAPLVGYVTEDVVEYSGREVCGLPLKHALIDEDDWGAGQATIRDYPLVQTRYYHRGEDEIGLGEVIDRLDQEGLGIPGWSADETETILQLPLIGRREISAPGHRTGAAARIDETLVTLDLHLSGCHLLAPAPDQEAEPGLFLAGDTFDPLHRLNTRDLRVTGGFSLSADGSARAGLR